MNALNPRRVQRGRGSGDTVIEVYVPGVAQKQRTQLVRLLREGIKLYIWSQRIGRLSLEGGLIWELVAT